MGKWKPHYGGSCPVPYRTLVDVRTRDGHYGTKLFAGTDEFLPDSDGRATAEDWTHDGTGGDIIEYRVRQTKSTDTGMAILKRILERPHQRIEEDA